MFPRNDSDLYAELKIKRPRPINILHTLLNRELGYSQQQQNKTETQINELKRVYLAIHPNFTVINVRTPNCYLRRFSPDGRFLIAFNQHLNGIIVYKFNGCTSAQSEMESIFKTYPKHLDKTDLYNAECEQLRLKIFNLFFKEIRNIKLVQQNELINRECTLFYDDNYLIVASSEFISDDSLPAYHHLAQNNEAIHVYPIENYTIYLINIKTCQVCDTLTFKHDKIILTHNQGLNLYRNVFSVLSQQNQTIYIYKIIDALNDETKNDKQFLLITQIGRFCYRYDTDLLQNSLISQFKYENAKIPRTARSSASTSRSINEPKAFTEPFFTSLKQRLITFFYKEAVETNNLPQFYSAINGIINLKIYRVQLLDEKHLFIKYTTADFILNQKTNAAASGGGGATANVNIVINASQAAGAGGAGGNINHSLATAAAVAAAAAVANNNSGNGNNTAAAAIGVNQNLTSTSTNPLIQSEQNAPFFFVLYNIETTEILNVFRNNSAQLLFAYENFLDYFTLTSLDTNFTFHTLPSNNIYARQILQRNIKNITKFNNQNEMIKCFLTQLPISSQSFVVTPYLDHSLYSYDEKFISNFDRPKAIGDQIIKFNNRENGRLAFKLYPGMQQQQTAASNVVNNQNQTENNNNPIPNNNVNNNNNNNTLNYQATLNQIFQNVPYKRLVAFIWHPREAFCISVQRGASEYNVNFHIYKK